MATPFHSTEYIDQYLSGTLSPEEQTTFEQAMKEQPTLAKEVKQQLLIKGGAFKIGRDEWHASKSKELETLLATSSRNSLILKLVAGFALLFTIGFGITQLQGNRQTSEELFMAYYKIDPAPGIRQYETPSPLQESYIAFNALQYEKALSIWDTLSLSSDPFIEDQIRYYRGLSLLELGQEEKGMTQFGQITDPAYQSKADWYWALLQVKTDQYEEAIPVLERLAQQVSPFQEKAVLLLKDLSNR